MANDIRIDLKLSGEQATARGLDRVGDAAEGAGSDLEGMAKDAGFLDRRLDELRKSTRELANEFARTGDKGILKQLKADQRELAQLGKISKQFFEIGTSAGDAVGKGLVKSLAETGGDMRNALGAAKGPAIAGAVALGAAVSPIIGAAVSAGVLGAVGGGGIAGGIALAARDSRVQAEAAKLGETISEGLTSAGSPFVSPLIESIGILKAEFGDTAEGMREALGTIAPVLTPLVKGLDGLIDEAMPGLIKGLQGARPVIRAIANELPDLGEATGEFFGDISENADAAVGSIKALSQAIQFTMGLTSGMVGTLSDAYLSTQKFGVDAAGAVAEVAEELQYIAPIWSLVARGARTAEGNYRDQLGAIEAANDASGDFRDTTQYLTTTQYRLGGALTDVTGGLEIQRKAMLGLIGTHLDMRRATADVEEAIDGFSESVRENGTSLDERDEKGRRNIDSIEAGIDALLRGAQAAHDNALANGLTALEAEAAAKRYREKYIPALEEAAVKAGFNRDQVQKLLDVLDKLDGKQVVYHLVRRGGLTIGAEDRRGHGFIPAGFEERAAGGPVLPGQTYVVGENGPEVLQMGSTGGHVYSAAQTAAMMGGSAGGTISVSMPPPILNVTVQKTGVRLDDIVMEAVAYNLRVNGGHIGEFQIPRIGELAQVRYEARGRR